MNPKLHHPKRVVRSLFATAAFYESTLGIKPYKWTQYGYIGRWGNQIFEFGLGTPSVSPAPEIRRDVDHWAFKGVCIDQVTQVLEQQGVEYKTYPIGEGENKATQVFFQDPDGHFIEIIIRDADEIPSNLICEHICHKGIHHLSI